MLGKKKNPGVTTWENDAAANALQSAQGGSPAGINVSGSNHVSGNSHIWNPQPNVSPGVYIQPQYQPGIYTQPDIPPAEPDPRIDKLAERLDVDPVEEGVVINGPSITGEEGQYAIVDLFVAMAAFMERFRLCPECGKPGEIAAGDYLCTTCRS